MKKDKKQSLLKKAVKSAKGKGGMPSNGANSDLMKLSKRSTPMTGSVIKGGSPDMMKSWASLKAKSQAPTSLPDKLSKR